MNQDLHAGLEFELRFVVPSSKTVPALYPESDEFQQMPEVLATGYFVGLLEWACIKAINPYLDWPGEQTVGRPIDVSHGEGAADASRWPAPRLRRRSARWGRPDRQGTARAFRHRSRAFHGEGRAE